MGAPDVYIQQRYYMKSQTQKAQKLSTMYDISNPKDLFTLLPQEMEIAEVRGFCEDLDGSTKRAMVLEIMLKIAAESDVEIDPELLGFFVDTIASASKGKYGLNKGSHEK
jgi:hypothetical protein